jgi:DNA-directed RNA polymerase subunit L
MSSKNIIQNHKFTTNKLTIYFKHVPVQIINSLRRVIESEIPIFCINNPVYEVNTSSFMHNDHISLRLELLPLNNDESLNKGDVKNAEFSLNITCPDKFELYEVTSKDIISSDGVKYFDDNYIITYLKPKESIKVKMNTVKGIPKKNAKFQSIIVSNYSYDDEFIQMTLEDNYVLHPLNAYKAGTQTLINKLNNIKTSILQNNDQKIIIEKLIDENKNKNIVYQIKMYNEDHTLGSIIQNYIANNSKLYCGYHMPHPLENIIIFKIESDFDIEEFKNNIFIKSCIDPLIDIYMSILSELESIK